MHLLALVSTRYSEEVEMSLRRLITTSAAMAAIAVLLSALTPDVPAMTESLTSAQRTVDSQGADELISSAAGLLAWVVWLWGALGLALTGASALPGMAGAAARLALHGVLPAGARRAAALTLGLGIGVAAPVVGVGLMVVATPASAAAPATSDVPDWPAQVLTDAGAVPDWPAGSPDTGTHIVVRGDCLWDIAATRLLDQHGHLPTSSEIATAVRAWWTANADVIGPDPDLLLPGQVLRTPDPP
jgi:nucleoid-associated protein YgaU